MPPSLRTGAFTNEKPRQPTGAVSNVSLLSRKDIATRGTDETICLELRESRVERRSPHIGRKSYNFSTSHHATRKTQTLTRRLFTAHTLRRHSN